VNRIIRKKGTRAYLSADGEWAADYRVAQGFESMECVLSAMEKHKLMDVELVMVMGENPCEDYDVALPLVSWRDSALWGTFL
jgi:hypothetical protein